MRILISLLVLVSLYACTPVYAQDNGVIASPLQTTLRSDSGVITLENGQLKPITMVFGSETASPVSYSFTSTGFTLPALTLSGNLLPSTDNTYELNNVKLANGVR